MTAETARLVRHSRDTRDIGRISRGYTVKRNVTIFALAFCLVMALAPSGTARAADSQVLRIVSVELSVEPAAYAAEIERGKAILKKLGIDVAIFVWQGTFAGDDAGKIMVGVRWPSLAAFHAAEEKTAADAEYQAWLKGLGKIRKVTSDKLFKQVLP